MEVWHIKQGFWVSGVSSYGGLSGWLRLFNGRFNYSVGLGLKVWFSGAIAELLDVYWHVNTVTLVFVTSVIRRRCKSAKISWEEYVESSPFRTMLIGF